MNSFVLILILFLICGIGLFIVLKPKKQPGSPTCKDYIVLEPTITKDKCIAPSYCWDTTCHSKPGPDPDSGCSGFLYQTTVDEKDCTPPNLCWKEKEKLTPIRDTVTVTINLVNTGYEGVNTYWFGY